MEPDPPLPADFVLLANTRADKGYDLILDVAALRPDIAFVCIASQSSPEEALYVARQRKLVNVHVVPRTDDMIRLYRAARVVAVPSYQFVETFSRVCIEAQRHGKPVLGADVGNIPYLLKDSGFVMPPIARAWAAELGRLYGDVGYYQAACAAALRNSAAYPYADQRHAILSVLHHAEASVLVGIGSGIGNMIHAGPMIRRLAQHLGRPVDLLSASDHDETLFVLHNPAYVNTVYPLRQFALARRYDTIFLTHCFGEVRVPVRAGQVIWSRDWKHFNPGEPMHEAAFNLEAAKQLLGVEYSAEDVLESFVGDIAYRWPGGKLVGFHGGSKPGHWATKRWPHFTALAALLKAEGYRVASFGIAEEYVDGTEDMTGGSVQQMTERMLACSYFVSNDSGVMNIANGLGIPLVAVFGPTNVRTRGPLRATSRAIHVKKDCAPCESRDTARFASGACDCIGEISLQQLADVFMSLVRDIGDAADQQAPPISLDSAPFLGALA